MTSRRAIVLVFLLYVTLDLSLPAMPGAFVFQADESVESTHVSRGRSAADVQCLPGPIRDRLLAPPAVTITVLVVRAGGVTDPPRGRVLRPPRAALECASSDDPA